jgi:hypothetical protein
VTDQDQQQAVPTTDRLTATPPAPPVPQVPQVPAPRQGPIPDLGFFAGAPQPRDSGGFGTPASAPFGTPASPFSTPASPFGGPVAPLPTAGPLPGAGRPALLGPLEQLRSTAAGRWALRTAAGLAVSLVLGLAGIGRLAGLDLFGRDITVPASLGGQSPVADSAYPAEMERQMEQQVGDSAEVDVEAYGAGTSTIVFIGAAYDEATPDTTEVATLLGSSGGANTRTVGDAICTEMHGGASVLCAHLEDGLMVAIVTGGRTVEDTALITAEAWDAQ